MFAIKGLSDLTNCGVRCGTNKFVTGKHTAYSPKAEFEGRLLIEGVEGKRTPEQLGRRKMVRGIFIDPGAGDAVHIGLKASLQFGQCFRQLHSKLRV
jgi:hypothetical protein